jgi:hypothetical protein
MLNMEKKFQSWSRQPNCYSNIKMRTNMAEQSVEKRTAIQFVRKKSGRVGCANKTAIRFIKKWQSWLRQQNCYTTLVFGTLFPVYVVGGWLKLPSQRYNRWESV